MANLVYLICSLPSLSFEQTPPMSLDSFHEDAKKQLSKKQFGVLQQADLRSLTNEAIKGKHKGFADMVNAVYQDLAEIRSAKSQNKTPRLNCLPRDVASKNPLEREIEILKWQWQELDTLESGSTFSFKQVLAYKMRLQILLRLQSFNAENGAEVLASVVDPSKSGGK